MIFNYGIDHLTVDRLIDIAYGRLKGVINEEARINVNECRRKVEKMATSNKAIYGINTGFGPLCDVQISPTQTSQLQENLLMTHAVGVGNPIDSSLSKIMLICKLHALCQGFSGIRLEVIPRKVLYVLLSRASVDDSVTK